MWPFRAKTQRRQEIRRGPEAPRRRRWRRFADAGGVGAALVALASWASVLALDAWPLEPLPYRVGQYVDGDVYARAPFEDDSPTKTAAQRDVAVKLAPAVIALNEPAFQKLVTEIRNLPGNLKSATQPAQVDEQTRRDFRLDKPEQLAAFAQFADPARAVEFNAQIDRLAANLQKRYVVTDRDFSQAFHAKTTQDVRLADASGAAQNRPKHLLLSLDNSRELGGLLKSAAEPLETGIRDNILYYLQETLAAGTGLYRLDAEATRQVEDAARASVKMVRETIPAGKRLVPRSAEGGLNDGELALLAKEHRAFLQQKNARPPHLTYLLLAGRAGMVLAVVALLAVYVRRYRPQLTAQPAPLIATAAVLVLALVLSKIVIGMGGNNPHLAVLGLFLAAAILTIAYDQRFAFALSGALAVLTALQLRLGLDELLVYLSAAAATVFQLHEVRTRSKLIEAGGLTAVAALAVVWAVESAGGLPVRFMLVDGCWAAGAAIAGGFIAQGILPLAERLFGVATSLTLLEWCDASKPLLKRLALEAPGTYNHSLVLGTMCEAAGDAIGARGLLGRVGAYYHDVGKINKPDYFVENRAGPGSRHDRLSPAMSLLVIKGHVKDGLELAAEYGLPRVLREFIASHHGTTLVEYFYHAAAQQHRNPHQRPPDQVEFRYPGPKPRSKEAAILMLADAAESSVRALGEPTPGRVETQVHAVINKRLMDGQLDECDLTLRQVHEVEVSLVKSLGGIYHGRVLYPSQKSPQASAPPPSAAGAPSGNSGTGRTGTNGR